MYLFRRGPGVTPVSSSGDGAANAIENDVNAVASVAKGESDEGDDAQSHEESVHEVEVEEVEKDRENEGGGEDSLEGDEDVESEYETDDGEGEESPRKKRGWFSFLRRGKDDEESDEEEDEDEDETSDEEGSDDESEDEGKDHEELVTSGTIEAPSKVHDIVQSNHVQKETTNDDGRNVASNKNIETSNIAEPETPYNKHREIITNTLESPPPPPLTIEQQQDEAILMAQAIQRVQQRIQSKGGNLYEALSEEDKKLVDALRGVDDEEKIREVVKRSMEKEWGIGNVVNGGGGLVENGKDSEKLPTESNNEVESERKERNEVINGEVALASSATKKPAVNTETLSMLINDKMSKTEVEADQSRNSVASSEPTIQAANTNENDAADKSVDGTNQSDAFSKSKDDDVVTEPSLRTEQSIQDESVQTEKSMANSTIPSISPSPTPINTSTESSLETVNSLQYLNDGDGAMLAKETETIAEKESDKNADRFGSESEENGHADDHDDDEDDDDEADDDDDDEPTIEEKRSLLSLAAEHDSVDVINELLSM